MVRVTGQLDAPLLDIGAVKQDYWERKTIILPSLTRLHKSKGWRSWFTKKQSPKIILRRLKSSQWEEIQHEFAEERVEIAKSAPRMRALIDKTQELESLTSDEKKFMLHVSDLSRPVVYGMIAAMSEEPKLTYDEVMVMMEVLDDFDRNTLVALVNGMTSQKASAMKAIYQERSNELAEIKATQVQM